MGAADCNAGRFVASRKKPVQLQGVVRRELVRKGTASEHQAVVLHTDAGETLILQRIGGNAFDDPATKALAGKRVVAEGFRLGRLFRYLTASEATSDDGERES